MIIKSLLTVATCVLVSGCGSQFAGTWNGTADIGPIDALTMTVVMPEKGLQGKITIRTKKATKTYQICQASLDGDRFEMQYDVDPLRQSIADSWPNKLDDTVARQEWDWSPLYDLDAMVDNMLENLRRKLA